MNNQLWVFLSTLLVLSLTFGLCILYGGVSRVRHSISSMFQVLIIIPVVSLIWILFGHNLAFSSGGNIFWGDFSSLLLSSSELLAPVEGSEISLALYSFFQLTFAIVACCVVVGAYLERTSYKFNILFISLWLIFIYIPVARWVWGPSGWLHEMGSLDFAGGLVVHITSGVSGLLMANLVGRRIDYFKLRKRYNNGHISLGIFLIWLGWFGFNGGSSFEFSEKTIIVLIVTFVASIASLLTWLSVDLIHTPHKITLTSYSLGMVSGLVAITPAAGYVTVLSALKIGLLSGFLCNYCARAMHKIWKVDDVLEVFSTHGFGGFLGAILTAIYAERSLVGSEFNLDNLLKANLVSSLIVIFYTLVVTFIIYKVCSLITSPRVASELENEGIDLIDHGERVINP